MSRVRLPHRLPGQSLDEYLEKLVSGIEQALNRAGAGTYTVKNAAPLRTLDAAAATPEQTAQALATLIQDLRTGGVLG